MGTHFMLTSTQQMLAIKDKKQTIKRFFLIETNWSTCFSAAEELKPM